MFKVLVANSNEKRNSNLCKYLSSDTNLKVFGKTTGIETLNTYLDIEPDIFVLGIYFRDISGLEIVDKLCLNEKEKRNCNTIITTNNMREQLLIRNTSKIYKIMKNPKNKELLNVVQEIYVENKYPELDMLELRNYLFALGFHASGNAIKYIESAIELCYYFPNYLASLDKTLNYVAKVHNTNSITVRDSLRASLRVVNTYIEQNDYSKNSYLNYFDRNIQLTPKTFIEKTVVLFRMKMRKKNKQ